MIRAEVRRGDGLSSGRPWLLSVVKNVQKALHHAGYALEPDGKFGRGTERVVRRFQEAQGLAPQGVVERATWQGLDPHLAATVGEEERALQRLLRSFRGDLNWVHLQEGHQGRPYWPGGVSGVTLDPGVDLGQVPEDRIWELYQGILTQQQLRALSAVFGIQGEDARTALNVVPGIRDIRISREQAYHLMPYMAKPYWDKISSRMTGLARKGTPPSVQTALMSLAYNRGPHNKWLAVLEELIPVRAWRSAAEVIGGMQQNHKLRGIRRRRREEAALISAELDFMGVA